MSIGYSFAAFASLLSNLFHTNAYLINRIFYRFMRLILLFITLYEINLEIVKYSINFVKTNNDITI